MNLVLFYIQEGARVWAVEIISSICTLIFWVQDPGSFLLNPLGCTAQGWPQ